MASRYTTTPRYSRKDSNYVSIGQRNFLAEADKLTADIKSLYDDYNTLYKQDSERGGGIDVYRTDSSAWYDNVSGLDSSLQAKADDVLKRVEYYKSYLDPEYYNNLTKSIGNIKSNGSSILANAQSMRDLYSNFKDEGEYMEWLEEYKYLNQDANEVKRELDNLKSQLDNLTGGNPNNFTPEAHELAKQYEEKTAYYNQLLKDQEAYEILSNKDKYNSLYEQAQGYKNPWGYSAQRDEAGKSRINKALYGQSFSPNSNSPQGVQEVRRMQHMNEDERYVYQVLFAQDPERAEEYYDTLVPSLQARVDQTDAGSIRMVAEIPVLREISAISAGVASGFEGVVNLGKAAITGQPVERSELADISAYLTQVGAEQASDVANKIVSGGVNLIGKAHGEDWSEAGKKIGSAAGDASSVIYTATMSGLQSIASGALMGGADVSSLIRTIPMAASAFSSSYNEALDRGMPDGQALKHGIVNALIEWGMEAASSGMSALWAKGGEEAIKSTLGTWLKEIGVNFAEESLTDAASSIYDVVANGEYSNYKQMLANGMTPEEALIEITGGIGLAGISGAIMGAEQMGVASIRNSYVQNKAVKSVKNQLTEWGYNGDIKNTAKAIVKNANDIKLSGKETQAFGEYEAQRKHSQLNHNLDELNFTMGASGRKEADLLDIGDRDPLAVATAFAARYKQGVNGSSIGGFDTAKYAILSETEQKIAYNAGKMDAAQTLSKKTEGFRAEKQARIDAENARIEAERQEAEAKKQKAIEAKEQATYKKMTPQMQENAEKYGLRKNGALAYAGDYTGDKSDASIGKYTVDFIKAYNAGKKGTDISRVPLGSLTDGQRRRAYNAGKADIEQNAPKFSSADIKATSGTTASSTVKQGSTKILADNSKAVANEISKIESPKMRQYAKDFKLGENGVKTYATAYNKSQNEGVYTQDFVAAYNVGKSGKDISEVKASSLTEAQKKQAYNAGKMDAIKATVDDKKSRTKTFGGGEKVIVADDSKLDDKQKSIRSDAEKMGIKIIFADIYTKSGKLANGMIDKKTGTIYLARDSKKAVEFIAKHEIGHYLEIQLEASPANKVKYQDLMNSILDSNAFKSWLSDKGYSSMGKLVAQKTAEYAEAGKKLDEFKAKQEIMCDFVGEELFGGDSEITSNLFAELEPKQKKTFGEWLKAVLDRIKKIFSKDDKAVSEIAKIEEKFNKLLNESVELYKSGEGTDEARFSFAGERAESADLMKLETAKKMLADGENAEKVRQETGWFKGYDGKWRFEIDDSDVKIQVPMLLLREGEYTLDEVLSHSNLFEAYPELKNMKVSVVRGGIGIKGVVGSYNASKDTLVLNSAIYLKDEQLREVIIHELQHKIQNIEGFARGSSPEYWKAKGISEDEYNRFVEKSQLQFQKEYQKLSEDDRQKVFEYFQLGKKIDSLLGQINFSNLDSTIDSTEKIFDELSNLESRHDALYDYLYYQPWFSNINTLYYQTEISDNLNTVFYKNTAGEIEARNAAERINLTAEQRKNTRPDIDREDVVFADRAEESNDIVILDNGNIYVRASRNVISGTTKSEQRKDITNFFNRLLQGRPSIDIATIQGEILTISKSITADKARTDFKEKSGKKLTLSNEEFLVKMNVAAHIDEVSEVSKFSNKKADSKNHSFAPDGFSYRTAYFEDFDGTYYKITLSIAHNKNTATVYNVGKITKSVSPTAKVIAVVGSQALDETLYDDSIAQENTFVNTSDEKSSENSGTSLSYTPETEQDLTNLVANGEITVEEYGRRMLEMRESKSADDIYDIARMSPEDMTTTPNIDRRKGEAKGDGESKFYGSIQRSSIFDETFKAEAKSDEFIRRYETITNKETLNKAAKLLDEGGEEFVKEWNNKEAIEMSPVDTAVGFILLSRYQDIGNYNSAIAVAEKLRKIGTVTGQNLQLFSITSRFDANMMQQWAQKELDKAFEEAVKGKAQKWIDKNKSKFELTEEDIDYIRTRTIQAAYLPNGSRDQAIRLAEISSRLQDKIPPNLGQSFKAWQRISMLLNPKTQIRNVLGNGVMVPAFIVSDWFGSAVDKAISKKTGVRTTGVAGLKATGENLKAVKQGMYESYDDFKRHINTKIDVLDRFSVGEGKSFNENKWGAMAKALNSMDRLTSFLLDFGDRPFYEAWFTNSLNNQMRLNNVTEPTLEMVKIAEEEALQRTWQDNNGMTQAVASIKKACNKASLKKLGLDYGLGDVLVKFTKTPANLTKAIYDFSPAAAISIATKGKELSAAISTGRATAKMQKDFVNAVGKAAAGTLLYTLFGLLYAMGRISGRSDDDKDVSAFEKYVQGIPEYSVKMFGKWWSYDWSQPIGAVPAIVANFMESRQQGDDGIFKSIWEAIRAGGEVLFEQSFMKSFQILFTADSFVDGLIEAVVGEATVPIPTILSQTANVFDPYRRSTYDNRSEERTILNKVKQKIPGLRNTLEVERDILGRETPNSQKNWFNAFFNPANTYTDTSTAVTDHVYELYQSTGKASAIPAKAPYDVTIKGVKHTFSIEERNEYQRIMGETSAQIIGELINNDSYMALTDEQKLEVITSVYSYAQSLAKSEMGLAESYDVISGIRDITEDEYNALSDDEIKAIADDYVLSSYYSISDFDSSKKATWFVNKSLPTAVNAAIKSGDMAKAQKLIKSVEANVKSLGLPTKEAKEMIKKSQASIKSEITSYWKEKFIEAHKRGDNGEKIRIKQMLVDTGLYGNSADVRDLTNGWKKEK